MARESRDPGFGRSYESRTTRVINKDGSFNVERKGGGFNFRDTYQWLIGMSWISFLGISLLTYLIINCLFALIYFFIGVESLTFEKQDTLWDFSHAFFFSVQTFTTVGYGAISPVGLSAQFVASIEAMIGLMSFALATGLLYGRFSKPSTRVLFSHKALIAPYKGINSLQFRVVNQRSNVLMEMHARVMLALTDPEVDGYNKNYYFLNLETPEIQFFPLSWTIVHPIDSESPFYGLTAKELEKREAEVMIQIKGFDDSFSQTVHIRSSYLHNEIVWGGKFIRNFYPDESGKIVVDTQRVHDYEPAPLNP